MYLPHKVLYYIPLKYYYIYNRKLIGRVFLQNIMKPNILNYEKVEREDIIMSRTNLKKGKKLLALALSLIMVATMMPAAALATGETTPGGKTTNWNDKGFVLDLTNANGYTGNGTNVTIKIGDKEIATSRDVVSVPAESTTPTLTTAAELAASFVTNEQYTIEVKDDTKLKVLPKTEAAIIPDIDKNQTHFTLKGLAEGSAMATDTEVVPLKGQFSKSTGYITDKYGIMAYKAEDFNSPKIYDIQGYHGGSWKSTTYGNNGYNVYLRTGEEGSYKYSNKPNFDAYLTVKPAFEFIKNGKLLKVSYTVKNSNMNSSKNFALGVSADVNIGSDDAAPIEEFTDGRGFKMTSTSSEDNGAQFNFFGKTTEGVTNVTGYGFDYFVEISNYEGDAFDITSRNSKDELGENVDSGMAYSWHDQTLAPNESKTYSIAIGIGGLGSEEAGGGSTEAPPTYIPEPKPEDQIDIAIDNSGNGEGIITENKVEKILEDQTQNGIENKEAEVVFNVKTSGTVVEGGKLTVNLPLVVQNQLIDKGVKTFGLNIEDIGIYLLLDNKAIENANKQAKGDINVNIAKKKDVPLSDKAKKLIGNRTLADINLSYGDDKKVENLGEGKSTIKFKTNLNPGEKGKAIVIAYIDPNGQPINLHTTYDENSKIATATTNHFSKYGVGYVTPPTKVNILRAKNAQSRASLRWSRATNDPEGYRVYRSETKDGKYKHIATIKNDKAKTYQEKAKKTNKTYYYKVRAYKQANGKAIWGAYSPIKAVNF